MSGKISPKSSLLSQPTLPIGTFKGQVSLMVQHPHLPLVAILMPDDHLIHVYRLANQTKQSHPCVVSPHFSFHGYFHDVAAQSRNANIVDLKWVGEYD
jgi:hypothetical protein